MIELLALVGLALLDSTSLGTLIIPLVLVIARRRVDVAPLAVYLGTVVAIYYALGAALMAGYDVLIGPLSRAWSSDAGIWVRLAIGVVLILVGVLSPTPAPRQGPVPQPRSLSLAAMVALGAGAALTEAATMLPYLAANGIITGMPIGWPVRLLVLAGYCLVMIMPAIVLIGLAATFGNRVWPRLERLVPRLEREAKVSLLWAAALVGIFLIRGAWFALASRS
ncbi:GAP family protein [Kocuria sp.]|uniref:GAP family protein n=1 Tax=Kocuria sp. TaxID=1871328 RepID=UPI0026DDB4F4|nr:GAP family protein [Kocuria sp.]MDO4920154.1 GAP family protein [Kocuria sp.]